MLLHLSRIGLLALTFTGLIAPSTLFAEETKPRAAFGGNGSVPSLAFRPDGKFLAWGCDDRSIKVWGLEKGKEVGNYKDREVQAVAFSPDGKTLASAESDEDPIKLLDAATGKVLVTFKGDEEDHQVLAFTP